MRLDLSGEVMNVDDRLLDTGLRQSIERMVEHRLAADLNQRLRQRIGNRAHALPEAGRQHDRPADRRRSGCGHANLLKQANSLP